MDVVVQKICCICGLDVRGRKRTKDPRGNYYCKPCYTARLAAYHERMHELAEQSRAGAAAVEPPAERRAPSHAVVKSSGGPRWAGLWSLLLGWVQSSSPADSTSPGPAKAAPVAASPANGVEVVEARRCIGKRVSGRRLRASDLLTAEAFAEVEAARLGLDRIREREVPVSPLTNPAVTTIVEDYTQELANAAVADDDDYGHEHFDEVAALSARAAW